MCGNASKVCTVCEPPRVRHNGLKFIVMNTFYTHLSTHLRDSYVKHACMTTIKFARITAGTPVASHGTEIVFEADCTPWTPLAARFLLYLNPKLRYFVANTKNQATCRKIKLRIHILKGLFHTASRGLLYVRKKEVPFSMHACIMHDELRNEDIGVRALERCVGNGGMAIPKA